MKINKNVPKQLKGMTLVEVVVAMIVFFVMFSAIISVLSVSLRLTTLSRSRDIKTGEQASQINKKSDTEMNNEGNNYQVVFNDTNAGKTDISSGKNLYKSVFARAGETFDFQLNTFGAPFGSIPTNYSGSNDYRLSITNSLSEPVTLYAVITNSDGNSYFYTGDPTTGYVHPSTLYMKHINSGGSIEFGFHDENNPSNDLKYYAVSQSGVHYGDYTGLSLTFNSREHIGNITP